MQFWTVMFTDRKGCSVLARTPLGAKRKAERLFPKMGKATIVMPVGY